MSVKVLGTMLYRQFGTKSTTCNRPFTVSFIIPGSSDQVETETFLRPKDFRDSFPGFRFINPKTTKAYTTTTLPEHVDPTIIYIAKHPLLARLKDYRHSQISDKAFEDKVSKTFRYYLSARFDIRRRTSDSPTRQDGWRILTQGDKDVAEWEGIWESSDGHTFFLEAKHLMDMASFSFMVLFVLLTNIL